MLLYTLTLNLLHVLVMIVGEHGGWICNQQRVYIPGFNSRLNTLTSPQPRSVSEDEPAPQNILYNHAEQRKDTAPCERR